MTFREFLRFLVAGVVIGAASFALIRVPGWLASASPPVLTFASASFLGTIAAVAFRYRKVYGDPEEWTLGPVEDRWADDTDPLTSSKGPVSGWRPCRCGDVVTRRDVICWRCHRVVFVPESLLVLSTALAVMGVLTGVFGMGPMSPWYPCP